METERDTCLFCNGTGSQTCIACNGTGKQPHLVSVHPERREIEMDCLFCNGKGKQPCMACSGKGYTERLVIQIPHPINIVYKPPTAPSPNIQTQQAPPSMTTSTSFQAKSIFGVIVLALLSVVYALSVFGFKRTIVAAEGFFLFTGWAGLQVADLFRGQESRGLENLRVFTAIGFGLCCGLLAAYLILTTSEGQAITEWVTAQTVRIVGSLFVSIFGLGMLELVWRRVLQWVREKAA